MKKEKLNVMFCSFPDFSSNAKPLYEYMKKRYQDKMNFCWVVRTDEMYNFLREKSISVCKLDSDEYFQYIKSADVLFGTHGDFAHNKPDGALYIELWHGIGPKSSGYLTNALSIDDYNWCKILKKKVDYFIVPSDFWRVIFAATFDVNYDRVLSLGYPKLDYFKDKKCISKLEKVLGCSVNTYSKIIYYMPTFRKGCNRQDLPNVGDGLFNVSCYNENALINFLEKNNYLLCIKKHPSEELSFSFQNNGNNIKIITDDSLSSNLISINEILDASDLLITDYSSLGVEYCYLNKPIIYLVHDFDVYQENRGIIFSNLDFWMSNQCVNTFDDLLESIYKSFNSKSSFITDMSKKRDLWFGNLKNGGCENICNFLFDYYSISDRVKYYYDYEEQLQKKVSDLNCKIDILNDTIKDKDKYIDSIVSSKGWIVLEKMRQIKNKFLKK